MFDDIKNWNTKDWLKALALIVIVLAVGFFFLNQFMQFRYSAYLLSKPCDICLKLNENISLCPKVLNTDNPISLDFLETYQTES